MSKYTMQDLAAKVDWEGGVAESIFGYGISAKDVPEEIREDWALVEAVKSTIISLENELEWAREGVEDDL